MSYERLTERQDDGTVKYIGGDNDTLATAYEKLKYRLAEFEEKIKNGLLVELPCKAGDTVYEIEYNRWEVCCNCPHYSSFFGMDQDCDMNYEIYPDAKKLNANCEKHKLQIEEYTFSLEFYARHLDDFGNTIFITKEAAEAKLKELKEKI